MSVVKTLSVKSVVSKAINHAGELFAHENISNLGLEEIDYDSENRVWVVTVGFSRPWDFPKTGNLASLVNQNVPPHRSFKIIRISDMNGEVLSVKNYPLAE
jgi:hypothetical protein